MRKFVFAMTGAAALGLAAFASQPAQAQGFSITVGDSWGPYGHGYRPYPAYRDYYGHRPYRAYPAYRSYPAYGRPVHYRPGPPFGYGPRCVVKVTRYFDGFGWVREKRRICR